ncbi:hypothetical protein PIB30_084042 [Stylosanthes scabra]|uniref:Uncharacterized protein n=1 Tax=Stylosanthes scabra TaxID=79078 RepID=A0ABU6WQP8_9FABA|nr:hypothetical protein [Stylosanthes scabra]
MRPDIHRHVRWGRGRGPDGEPQRPVGAMDSEEEEEYARQEDVPGPSAHGWEADPVQPKPEQPVPEPIGAQHDLAQPEQLGDDFFTGAEDDFAARFGEPEYAAFGQVDPDVGFLATVSGSQIEGIASRYQGIRNARITQQSTAPDLSWIPPVTPPSVGFVGGASSLPGHHFGTLPSWEYQPMQPSSRSSSTHPVHDQHPPPAPPHHQVIRPRPRRQRQPPPCGTSSHLQHPPPQYV